MILTILSYTVSKLVQFLRHSVKSRTQHKHVTINADRHLMIITAMSDIGDGRLATDGVGWQATRCLDIRQTQINLLFVMMVIYRRLTNCRLLLLLYYYNHITSCHRILSRRICHMSRTVYTVSQKTCHSQHFVRNVDQRWPIFQIISLLDCLFVWVNSVLLLIDLLPRTTSWNPSVQSSRILYARFELSKVIWWVHNTFSAKTVSWNDSFKSLLNAHDIVQYNLVNFKSFCTILCRSCNAI